MTSASIHALLTRARAEVRKIIIGQDAVIDMALVAIFTGHHALVEGVPGVAKTLVASAAVPYWSRSGSSGRIHEPEEGHVRVVARSCWPAAFAGDDAGISCGPLASEQGPALPSRSARD